MNPEQQRIAIAKACGWTDIQINFDSKSGLIGKKRSIPSYCHSIPYQGYNFEGSHRSDYGAGIPDYLNDLNAMHEVESFIRNAQDQMRYASETLIAMGFDDLMEASDLNVDYCWHVMGATAAQRAKAFLKTLNLWKP